MHFFVSLLSANYFKAIDKFFCCSKFGTYRHQNRAKNGYHQKLWLCRYFLGIWVLCHQIVLEPADVDGWANRTSCFSPNWNVMPLLLWQWKWIQYQQVEALVIGFNKSAIQFGIRWIFAFVLPQHTHMHYWTSAEWDTDNTNACLFLVREAIMFLCMQQFSSHRAASWNWGVDSTALHSWTKYQGIARGRYWLAVDSVYQITLKQTVFCKCTHFVLHFWKVLSADHDRMWLNRFSTFQTGLHTFHHVNRKGNHGWEYFGNKYSASKFYMYFSTLICIKCLAKIILKAKSAHFPLCTIACLFFRKIPSGVWFLLTTDK